MAKYQTLEKRIKVGGGSKIKQTLKSMVENIPHVGRLYLKKFDVPTEPALKEGIKSGVKGALKAIMFGAGAFPMRKKQLLKKGAKGAALGAIAGAVPGGKMFQRRKQMIKEAMAYKKTPSKKKKMSSGKKK